jgi:hypothetical protein
VRRHIFLTAQPLFWAEPRDILPKRRVDQEESILLFGRPYEHQKKYYFKRNK